MIKSQSELRKGPKNYHDLVFEEEIKELITVTKSHYELYVLHKGTFILLLTMILQN